MNPSSACRGWSAGPVNKPIEILVANNSNAPKAGKVIQFAAPVALAA